MDNRYLSLPFAVALGLASPCALALGLGQLQVKSGLNQPLVAEIPIISATPSELEKLDVRLASPDAFARVGLEQPGELTANLQFSIGKNARGQPVILVTTPGRFSEPLLSFLIEAEWGKGRVTREYTALIDPPYIAAAVIQPMLAPPVAAAPAAMPAAQPIAPPMASQPPPPTPAETAPIAELEPARPPAPVVLEPQPQAQPIAQVAPPPPVEPAPPPPRPAPVAPAPRPQAQTLAPPPARREPAPVAPTPAPAPGKVGPIAPGQTLWSIANQVRPDPAVSINQMMVALLRANPDAFAQDNINLLKRGSVLRVPGQEEVGRLSEDEAAALVSQQAAAWRMPRQAVPQPAESASEMAAAEPVAAKPAAPKPAASKPAPATPAAAKPAAAVASTRKPSRPASRLEIVPPSGNAAARGAQSGAAAGAGGSELRAELAQAREDLAARSSEVTELKSRVAELEQQDTDRQKLIEMQNSQMKDLQDRLAQMEAAPAAAPATVVAPAQTPAIAAAAPATSETAPVPTPWYLNPFLLGGALLLLVGGLVLGLRRNKAPMESDPSAPRLSNDEALRASMAKTRQAAEKITPVAAPGPVVVPAAGVVAVAAAGATAPTSGSERELQVFRDAVKARPQDIEAHLSLLRLLHMRGNYEDFEAAAQEMRAHVPSTLDPRWREVVIMGASLMPANAQFGEAGWNTPRFQDSAAPARAGGPIDTAPSPSTPTFLAEASRAAPAMPEAEPVKVFDPPPADPADLDDLDFSQFDSALAGGSSSMDIHRSEAQVLAENDASATRIELAKAYLDIGDLDGARSMLEEVVSEGGPAAQAEAGRILKEIG